MKKISNLVLVSILTMLTACGGGGRGGVNSDLPSIQDVANNGNTGNGGSNTTTGGNGGAGNTDPSDPTGGNGGSGNTDPSDPTGGNGGSGNTDPSDPTGGNGGSGNTDPSDPTGPTDPTIPNDPMDSYVSILPSQSYPMPLPNPFPVSVDEELVQELNGKILDGNQEFLIPSDFRNNYLRQMLVENKTVKHEYVDSENAFVDDKLSVELWGNSIGLQYSDFGYWTAWQENSDNGYYLDSPTIRRFVALGKNSYETNPIVGVGEDMIFRGKAAARIKDYDGNGKDISYGGSFLKGDATLAVSPVKRQLDLLIEFDRWYDVTFSGFSGSSGFNGQIATFKKGSDYQTKTSDLVGDRGDCVNIGLRYFGNEKIEESVGTFSARFKNTHDGYSTLEGSYGVKRVN